MAAPSILVVAGEASGDQHAADLVAELKRRRPELRFFGMGGPRLSALGVDLIHDAKEVSVMGITEVLPKIPRILRVMRRLSDAAARRRPLGAVLVDIPDFNLRLARRLRELDIPIAYYVSPMIWAWRRGRVRTIRDRVDRMLCILPFEEPFYRRAGVPARYVGSPVVEQVPPAQERAHFRKALGVDLARPTLALLPGSRPSELRRILPTLVETARQEAAERKDLQVLVPLAPSVERAEIDAAFAGSGVAPVLVEGRAPEVVGAADVAVVASGTAALEAGLMERPLVVVYRVSALTYWVGRLLLKVAFVSLVNLLSGRRVVPELLQAQMTARNIRAELARVWVEGPEREAMVEGLKGLRARLGPPGAAARAADEVLSLLRL